MRQPSPTALDRRATMALCKEFIDAATHVLTLKQFNRVLDLDKERTFMSRVAAIGRVTKSEKVHALLQGAKEQFEKAQAMTSKPELTIVENKPEPKEEKMTASLLAEIKGLTKDSTDLRDVSAINSIIQAYSDCNDVEGERDLGFKSARYFDGPTALAIVSVAIPDGYNAFDSSVMAELVEAFPKAVFTIAREGSVCIYVHLGQRLWLNRGAQAFSKVDEFSVEADGTLRLWWD
jgi:hypothetical protein